MPTFYELLTEDGKKKWLKLGRHIKGFDFDPDATERKPVSAQGKLEDEEEIKYLMSMTPEKFKERFGE